MTLKKILADIENHINENDWGPYGWYFGIATDPKGRLFSDHQVREDGDGWIYCQADSEKIARQAEIALLTKYPQGQGGPGGGNNPDYVYAYKIKNHTKE